MYWQLAAGSIASSTEIRKNKEEVCCEGALSCSRYGPHRRPDLKGEGFATAYKDFITSPSTWGQAKVATCAVGDKLVLKNGIFSLRS